MLWIDWQGQQIEAKFCQKTWSWWTVFMFFYWAITVKVMYGNLLKYIFLKVMWTLSVYRFNCDKKKTKISSCQDCVDFLNAFPTIENVISVWIKLNLLNTLNTCGTFYRWISFFKWIFGAAHCETFTNWDVSPPK